MDIGPIGSVAFMILIGLFVIAAYIAPKPPPPKRPPDHIHEVYDRK